MLPSTVKFASRMKKMGIGDGARIVVYDTNGIFQQRACGGHSAPWGTRTWPY